MSSQVNNQRIAKNTLLLYGRTFIVMGIMLYTSRVVLAKLGVEGYGIYQVVGGFVAMFSIISSSLSASITRYITFELGRGDLSRLREIFSSSINIQVAISLIIIIVCEAVGVWFLNTQMTIPFERLTAANWVLQCSLLTFCVNLISVPYDACIIAHERMTAYAYISVLDAVLKLMICYMIAIANFDRLIVYAILMLGEAILIRVIYGFYCGRNFGECHYQRTHDRSLLKEMTGFAGWSFFPNIVNVFNAYGINLLINIFFGVTMNAARGIAVQAEGAVMKFVSSFTTAINPQITKSYAAGEKSEMFMLVCRGAKFSYYLLLFFAIPILLEANFILNIWLEEVPDKTVLFVRLTMIATLITIWGNTSFTACMATGDIKKYSIWVSAVGAILFPLTWGAYKLGLPVESTYFLFMFVYFAINIVRLCILKEKTGFPLMMFFKNVIIPIMVTTLLCILLPVAMVYKMDEGVLRFVTIGIVSIVSTTVVIYFCGLTSNEKEMAKNMVVNIKTKIG